jgi:hypothetical protein
MVIKIGGENLENNDQRGNSFHPSPPVTSLARKGKVCESVSQKSPLAPPPPGLKFDTERNKVCEVSISTPNPRAQVSPGPRSFASPFFWPFKILSREPLL